MDLSNQNNEAKKNVFFDENDDFDFRPLSDGLGFHHEEKISSKPQSTKSISAKKVQSNTLNAISDNKILTPMSASQPFIQSDLALFYENKETIKLNDEVEPKIEVEALKSQRFAAFLIDIILVSGVTSLTLWLVSQLTGVNFVDQLMMLEEMSLISVGFIFLSYYFVYFTLLEKMQGKTLGMDLFGLVMKSNSDLSLARIFGYEIVILFGLFSLGLTNYFNLPKSICGIKVIEKK